MKPTAEMDSIAPASANRGPAIILWLGVFFGFLLLTSAWFFLVRAAREAKVESVPLATQGGRP